MQVDSAPAKVPFAPYPPSNDEGRSRHQDRQRSTSRGRYDQRASRDTYDSRGRSQSRGHSGYGRSASHDRRERSKSPSRYHNYSKDVRFEQRPRTPTPYPNRSRSYSPGRPGSRQSDTRSKSPNVLIEQAQVNQHFHTPDRRYHLLFICNYCSKSLAKCACEHSRQVRSSSRGRHD